MTPQKYRLSLFAKAELMEIWATIFERSGSEESADKAITRIALKFATLADFPKMGRSREELGAGVRSFPVDRYVIFYRLVTDGIEMSHILYGSQDVSQVVWGASEKEDA